MDNTAKVGTRTTFLAFLLGNIFQLDKQGQDDVIFWMQLTAFVISIVVGILTAIYYIRKLKEKKEL